MTIDRFSFNCKASFSDEELVFLGGNVDDLLGGRDGDDLASTRTNRLALLGGLGGSLLLGLDAALNVSLLAVLEIFAATRRTAVLNSDVHALSEVARSNLLEDLHTDGVRSNVPHATSLTMVVLVGHTLVDGAVGLDVDVVSNLVDMEISLQTDRSVLAEVTGEHVTGAGAVTEAVRHFSVE